VPKTNFQIGSAANIGIQAVDNIQKNYQRLDARMPILLTGGVYQLWTLQV
jgi:hypothetical protein